MRGLLKSKSPLNQFLLLICIALVSFFIIGGFIGTPLMAAITGMSLTKMSDPSKWVFGDTQVVTMLRGLQLIQFISLFVIPAFICARLFSEDSKKYLGLRKPSNDLYWLVAIVIMLLAIPLSTFLGELNQRIPLPDNIAKWMQEQQEQSSKTTKLLLSQHTIKDLILNIILVAGLAGVGEELLFRGVAQRLLIKIFGSPVAGILVASIIFSAMHMEFYGLVPRFLLGVLLGFIYWYSGSLWVAMLAHFIYDAFLITVVYFNPSSLADEKNIQLTSLALGAIISLAIVTALFMWMRKKSMVTYEEAYADDAIPVKNHPF